MLTRLILWMIDKADEAVCQSAGEEDDPWAVYLDADQRQDQELRDRLAAWE